MLCPPKGDLTEYEPSTTLFVDPASFSDAWSANLHAVAMVASVHLVTCSVSALPCTTESTKSVFFCKL